MKVNWKLTTIKKRDAGYTLTYETPEGTKTVNARSLVLTVPAYVAKEILRPLSVCILPPFFFIIIKICQDCNVSITRFAMQSVLHCGTCPARYHQALGYNSM